MSRRDGGEPLVVPPLFGRSDSGAERASLAGKRGDTRQGASGQGRRGASAIRTNAGESAAVIGLLVLVLPWPPLVR
jgi:hypothetical protein